MYERPTHSVTLPFSKAIVVLYDYLVNKDLVAVRALGLEGADVDMETNPEKPKVRKFNVGITQRMEDLAMKLSIQKFSINGSDYKSEQAEIFEFVDYLHEDDAKFLAQELEKTKEKTNLSDEDKKKLLETQSQ